MNITLPPNLSPSMQPELHGFKIGPYRILNLIGRGGTAMVYRAYQPNTDRLVALKVLSEQLNQNVITLQRFQQEALLIAKLEHPNIIPVYDSGQEGDITYIAMRYMRAGTVRDLIANGPLSMGDASQLVNEIASALDYAHSLNIIHRDVKPNNILVDIHGHSYLSDFGLAKVLGNTKELTETNSSSMGTPAYMAPEQVLGLIVTSQTDIYALGVVLYEMLTGETPYSADTPIAQAMMHIYGEPRSPREINPSIVDEAEKVIMRAMAKEPLNRFRTATEMAQALAKAVAEAKEGTTFLSNLNKTAAEIAITKSPEEITLTVREEIRRQDYALRKKKLLKITPWIIGTVALIGVALWLLLTINGNQRLLRTSAQTATAVHSLLLQLGELQTASIQGQSGLEPTLAYLQTSLAGELFTNTPTNIVSQPTFTPNGGETTQSPASTSVPLPQLPIDVPDVISPP